jgi:hypothetical protein
MHLDLSFQSTYSPDSYEDHRNRADLDSRPNFVWCGQKGCKSGQIHLPSQSPRFRCQSCKKSHCVIHHVKWHKGETCAGYDYRNNDSLKKEEEEASRLLLKEMSKQCPGCKRHIEKIDGCDRITCEFLLKRGGRG